MADKDYHSNAVLSVLRDGGIRTYVSEPDRGRRNWHGKHAEREAVYANRPRISGERGKDHLRRRGELLERPFAHLLETGGMRRTHLRGHDNILKRMLVHVAGFNLSLLMRKLFGVGKPRQLQGKQALWETLVHLMLLLVVVVRLSAEQIRARLQAAAVVANGFEGSAACDRLYVKPAFATGC